MFHPFVIPFCGGLLFLLGIVGWKSGQWLVRLDSDSRRQLLKGILSGKTLAALREIFFESLLHRNLFRQNALLGYMHMSLAFGWFLLIAVGNLHCIMASGTILHPPYVPVFYQFFASPAGLQAHESVFNNVMDGLLLLTLSGVSLAWFKRMVPHAFGTARPVVHTTGDRFALLALWLVFPLRLAAESLMAGVNGNGGFITVPLGHYASGFLPVTLLAVPAYWAYSLVLGTFFCSLPFSRYLHIPAEVGLILFRQYSLRDKNEEVYREVEIDSCSRCGICLSTCQMAAAADVCHTQSVYFLRDTRSRKIIESTLHNCMLCGRCKEACPVGINTDGLRLNARQQTAAEPSSRYDYLHESTPRQAEVLYFAGCMGHLVPGVSKAMTAIFDAAGVHYCYMDEQGTVCCGRPLVLVGKAAEAKALIEHNRRAIRNSGAHTLVTSCPICYQVCASEYSSDLAVMHHTEFIRNLIEQGSIEVFPTTLTAAYHDPCELGRRAGIYREPREVLSRIAV